MAWLVSPILDNTSNKIKPETNGECSALLQIPMAAASVAVAVAMCVGVCAHPRPINHNCFCLNVSLSFLISPSE